jgi:L-asparaginase II
VIVVPGTAASGTVPSTTVPSSGPNPGPLTVTDSVELAVVERSGLVESRHIGAAVVVDASGEPVRELGNGRALIYPRSTLKLLQAIGVLRCGTALHGERLALATASHAGTPRHIRVIRAMLESAGLDESALACPADWPLDTASRTALASAGRSASPIYMNCSGKHAAFLLACVHSGWPTAGYLDPGHPLQRVIRTVVEEFAAENIEHSGVDGCGAPVHALSLRGLARAVGRVAQAVEPDTAALSAAILGNPWAIDGPGRPNTVTIETLGIIAKLGAEGVMVMGTPEGVAVAVKVLDGNLRCATMVALDLLVSVGAVDRDGERAVLARTLEAVLGGGKVVGSLRVAF